MQRTGPPGLSTAVQCHTETILKEELRQDLRLNRDMVLKYTRVCVLQLSQQRTQRDRVMLKVL